MSQISTNIYLSLSSNQECFFFRSTNVYAFDLMKIQRIANNVRVIFLHCIQAAAAATLSCRFLSVKFNLIMIEVSLERMKAGVRIPKKSSCVYSPFNSHEFSST